MAGIQCIDPKRIDEYFISEENDKPGTQYKQRVQKDLFLVLRNYFIDHCNTKQYYYE